LDNVSSVRHDQQNLDNMSVLSDMTSKIWTMSVLSDMTCKIWTICQSCQTWPAKFGQSVSPVRHDLQNLDNMSVQSEMTSNILTICQSCQTWPANLDNTLFLYVSSVRHDLQNLDNVSPIRHDQQNLDNMSVLSDMTCKILTICQSCQTWPAKFWQCQFCQTWPAKFGQYVSPVRHDLQNLRWPHGQVWLYFNIVQSYHFIYWIQCNY
jgi:hypothetical protein